MASSAEKRKYHPPTKMSVYMRVWRQRKKGKPLTLAETINAAAIAEKRRTSAKPRKLADQWLIQNVKLASLPTLVLAKTIGEKIPGDAALKAKTNWAARHLKALGAVSITINIPDGHWNGWATRDQARATAMDHQEKLALLNEVTGSKHALWPMQRVPVDGPDDPETGEPVNGWRWATATELCRLTPPDDDDPALVSVTIRTPDVQATAHHGRLTMSGRNDSSSGQPQPPVAGNGSGGTEIAADPENAPRAIPESARA